MKTPSKPSAAWRMVEVPEAAVAPAAAAVPVTGGGHRRSPFAMPIISSLALTTLLAASKARWVTTREIISVPTSTLDDSSTPCESRPRFSVPGAPTSAAPELAGRGTGCRPRP